MLNAYVPITRHAPPPLPPVAAMSAGAYLKRRREVAGLSIPAVATFLVARRRADAPVRIIRETIKLIALLESPLVTAKSDDVILALASIFPLDPDVYRQLAHEPADRWPFVCRLCGCSRHDPCSGDHDCVGVAGDVCGSCAVDCDSAVRS